LVLAGADWPVCCKAHRGVLAVLLAVRQSSGLLWPPEQIPPVFANIGPN
jgi:hypothetical protein